MVGSYGGIDVEMSRDVLQQLQHRRHLAFGKQIDLQIQVTTLIGLPGQPVLAGEHEQRQEDRFERHGHRQKRKGKPIERLDSGD